MGMARVFRIIRLHNLAIREDHMSVAKDDISRCGLMGVKSRCDVILLVPIIGIQVEMAS